MVTVYIQGNPVQSLPDTGSHITIIDSSVVGQLNLQRFTRPPNARSVTGHSLPLVGSFKASLEIGTSCFEQQIHIMQLCPYPCILGRDAIGQCNPETITAMMNHTCRDASAVLKENTPVIPVCNNIQVTATIEEDIEVPARQQMLLCVLVNDWCPCNV